jgi:hypothetical protein
VRMKCWITIVMVCLSVANSIPVAKQSTVHVCMLTAHREHAYVEDTSNAVSAQIEEYKLQSRVSFSINVAGARLSDAGIYNNNPLATLLQNRVLVNGPDCHHGDPPCEVRQQGLDVANALTSCSEKNPGVDWIILLEDDFMPCDHALTGLIDTLDTLDLGNNKFARFTQGAGGVAFPRENVPLYASRVLDNIETKPCDWVLLEGWSSKPDYVFERHLFQHIGSVSTIGYRNEQGYVREYAGLRDNSCGDVIRV